jgi:hypothetical protein
MAEKTRLDMVHIAQLSFDEELGASRVHLVDADLAIELSADDGDSVITKKQTKSIPVKDGDVLDLSMASKVCLIGAEGAKLSAVLDNEEILVYNIVKGSIVDICLTKVKISLDGVDKAYLMVQ